MRSRHPHDRLRDDMLRSGERTLLAALRVLDEVHRQVPHPCHGGCTAPGADHLAPHLDAESRLADGVFRHLWFMGSRRRCLANSNQRYVVYSLFYKLLFLFKGHYFKGSAPKRCQHDPIYNTSAVRPSI